MIGFEICSSNEVQGKWCTVAGGAIRGAVGGDVEGYERDETRAIDRSAVSLESHGSRRRFDSVGVGVGVFDVEGWMGMAAGDSCQDTGEAQQRGIGADCYR
jgi:hypothetical protein